MTTTTALGVLRTSQSAIARAQLVKRTAPPDEAALSRDDFLIVARGDTAASVGRSVGRLAWLYTAAAATGPRWREPKEGGGCSSAVVWVSDIGRRFGYGTPPAVVVQDAETASFGRGGWGQLTPTARYRPFGRRAGDCCRTVHQSKRQFAMETGLLGLVFDQRRVQQQSPLLQGS